jgi:hypothetical protein
MLAAIVFGSLGRGTWDAYSDLDLDVVIADGVTLDVTEEVRRMCEALREHPAVILLDGGDEAHVVLDSLIQMSVRYHPLHSTSPNIVDIMQILTGRIGHADIYAAGSANAKPRSPALTELVSAWARIRRGLAVLDLVDQAVAVHRARVRIRCRASNVLLDWTAQRVVGGDEAVASAIPGASSLARADVRRGTPGGDEFRFCP